MAIPTAPVFLLTVGKGPNLNVVHRALDDYWIAKTKGPTLAEETQVLQGLIDACKAWIKKKESKSEYKTNMFGMRTNYVNTKFTGRRKNVAELGESATQEMMELMRSNGLLIGDSRGQLSFDIKKFKQKAHLRMSRHEVKALDSGYVHERTLWLGSGKTSTISGSKMHGLSADTPTGGWNRTQVNALANVTGSGGSATDWKVLAQIRDLGNMNVAFLRKDERYKYMVYVSGGLFVDKDDGLYTSTDGVWARACMLLWAMDGYGNMFIYDHYTLAQTKGLQQGNHSSVNAGKDVICAGMITVDKGVVTDITNTSGHYKPSKENLARALHILVDEGLDLSQATIRAIRPEPTTMAQVWWQTFDLNQFLASHGNCACTSEVLGPKP